MQKFLTNFQRLATSGVQSPHSL